MAVEFKVRVVKTEGYKGLDCGSIYVGWKEIGFVLEVKYGGREGFLHVTRGVEGFDVQGSVVGEVGMSSSIGWLESMTPSKVWSRVLVCWSTAISKQVSQKMQAGPPPPPPPPP